MTANLLTPAEVRRDSGKFTVSVRGIQTAVAANKPDAISSLCRYAIERRETVIVTVLEGAGKNYLTISPLGVVAPSTAPAPNSVRPNLQREDTSVDLGVALDADDDTRAWVEQTMLDPGDEPEPSPAKRRFGFGRRG